MTALSRRTVRYVVVAGCGVAGATTPAAAHGTLAGGSFVSFPVVVAASVLLSLLAGGVIIAADGRRGCRLRRPGVCGLLLLLGGGTLAIALNEGPLVAAVGGAVGFGVVSARGGVTDCEPCADATLGAVTVHRVLEGSVLATVYAADATVGLVGAAVVTVHATAETVAVGAVTLPRGRSRTVAAVCLVQTGFVGGALAGSLVAVTASPALQSGVLGLVGGVLAAVGARETYQRFVVHRATPA